MGERNLMGELMEAHDRLRHAVADADAKSTWGLPAVVAAMAREEAVMAEMLRAERLRGGERL